MSFQSLKNFWKTIKRDKFLLIALLVGLMLRGLNSTYGSPSLYVSNDEAIAHLSAFNMIANRTPISIANYTPLGAYIQIPFLVVSFIVMKFAGYFSSVSDFEIFVLTHEGYFLFIPRLISAFFGTLAILVVYKITLELFKKRPAAIIAAFLTAVSFNLVHISHFARPWSAALFFFTLAFYLALKHKRFAAPFLIAISFGFHQVGILAIPFIVSRLFKRPFIINIASFFIMAIIIFGFSLLTLKVGVVDAIARDQSFIKEGKFLADLILGKGDLVISFYQTLRENLSVYFLINLLVTDGILVIFSVFGLFKYLHYKKVHIEIFIYILLFFILASLFFHPLIRYLLPMLVLLIPFSAWVIDTFFAKKKLAMVIVIFAASINSIWWNLIYIKKPTFIQASDWINQNIPVEFPLYYLGGRFQTFAPNLDAIATVQRGNEDFAKRLANILPETGVDNVRNVVYVSNFPGRNKLEQLVHATNGGSGYALDYYLDPKDRVYNLNPESFEVIVQFIPTRNGQFVKISEPQFDASWNFPTNNFKNKVSMYSLSNAGPYVDILYISNPLK